LIFPHQFEKTFALCRIGGTVQHIQLFKLFHLLGRKARAHSLYSASRNEP
jgi:hypothetical protein